MNPRQYCFLIDNDEDDQEIFLTALAEINPDIKCFAISNGYDAIQKLSGDRNDIPSFIFIDMNMPLMDGRQCLEEIRKMEHLQNVPVYMYSTAADPRSVEGIKMSGADGFIIKPASFAALRLLLTDIVNKS